MLSQTYYDVGTVSVTNGNINISWAGTSLGTVDEPIIMPGDLLVAKLQPGIPPQRIATIDYVAKTGTLWAAWPGTTNAAATYEARYVGIIERSTAQRRTLLEKLGLIPFTPADTAGPGMLDLYEQTTNGSSRTRLKPTAALGANTDFVLPPTSVTMLAYIVDLLNAGNHAAAQTAIGISAFAQTLLDDTTLAALWNDLAVTGTSELSIESSGTFPTVSSYAVRTCYYWKIGKFVYFNAQLRATVSAVGTGSLRIVGLPFAANAASVIGAAALGLHNLINVGATAAISSTTIAIYALGGGNLPTSAIVTGSNNYLYVAGCYLTDA